MNNYQDVFDNFNEIDKKGVNAYRSARQFKDLSAQSLITLNGKFDVTIIACIVNSAFACELFLKSIIILQTKKMVKGHSLCDLLEKSGLLLEVKSRMKLTRNFDKEILKIEKAFEDWRYVYESNGQIINNGFLSDFCDILEELAREKILNEYGLNMKECFC